MSDTPTKAKRKIGIVTILSSLFIIFLIVWGAYTLILIQAGEVRTSEPHTKLDDIAEWPYDINWAGGRTNWFENINYTDLPLDQMLPEDLLAMMNNTIFVVEPANPAQLWRSSAYDAYDGSGWSKTLSGFSSLAPFPLSQATNDIYTISMNVSISPSVEPVEMPALFPNIRVIEDSFRTVPAGRLIDYTLETDQYDTFLFSPFLTGSLDETILIQYDVTYDNQDLTYIQNHALPGELAEASIASIYGDVGVTLSQIVLNETTQFETIGDNAYEKAMAVDVYFRNSYELLIDNVSIYERPQGQEVTEWFIERGGGLPMDFATAYCVFMRQLGVPARMTIGYAMGEPDPDGGDFRRVQVKHMMFWVEVYIPQDDGPGQWIQVIPLPLPPEFGGGALPENFDQGDVSLQVFSVPFVEIGTDFNIYALLRVNNVTINTPENIRFYDLTDGVDIGTTTIQPSDFLIPLANITYQFPVGATIGVHNITAMWISTTFLVSNFTFVIAVGQSNPFQAPQQAPDVQFLPSETIDMDISLGLSDYEGHWNDTLYVHGVMTISGSPANGTYLGELGNDQMWILWDGIWYGNATIAEDGYYELDIIADGTDLLRMLTGQHNVSAFYAGAYDPDTGFPVVLPGSSADSTINLRGLPGFDLTVIPVDTYGGGSITYDGLAYLQNGTPLVGETIGIIFDGVEIDSVITNSSGGFNYVYNIPLLHPSGTFDAQVNWTAPLSDVDGDTSLAIPVTVQSGATTLTIDSTPKDPDPVHIYEAITIFGTLTVSSDGTPLIGKTIEIWWNDGTSTQMIGSNTTIAGGYYEFTYTIPAGSEGTSTYWAEWDASAEPNYQDAISSTMDITVKRYDVIVTIETIQSSVVVGEELDIQGVVFLPEFPALLGGAHLTLWWQNGTGTYNITGVYTSGITGIYTFNYTVPITHELATIQLWAEYISESPALSSNVSAQLGIVVRNYQSFITVLSNQSVVHLNESVLIYGYLEHENGTPLTGYDVDIEWNNGSSYFFPVVTNSTGWYKFLYNCSIDTDDAGTVTVTAYHTSIDPTYSSSSAVLTPSLTLQLYQLTLDANVISNSVHLDEVIIFNGTLTLDATNTPVAGATIVVYYMNSTGTFSFPKITNSSGAFIFQYNCSLTDALGAVYVWAQYNSTDQLWDNAESLNRTVNLILYSMTLTTLTNDTAYYIDQTVQVWGRLTYTHNSTPLAGQPISIWWFNGSTNYLGTVVTNSSGYYNYYYNLTPSTDSVGLVTVWAEFTTTVPLWDNATSAPGITFSVNKYGTTLDITVLPNPVYLNESVTIQVHLYYTHNGTDISGEWVSIWWQNSSIYALATGQTDGSGLYSFVYSGMDDDTFLTPIMIYANYTESTYFATGTSSSVSLTLDRWLTLITGFDTGGTTTFLLTDTIIVNGTLYYDLASDIPYGGVIVQILVDGSPVNTTITASDGTFTGYWKIPGLTPTGNHDISVRYLSSVNWIADYETAPITVTINAINIIWTFNADPNAVYRSEWLYINGTLALDNGSLYVGATVTIIWENTVTATGPRTITTVVTDGSGQFEFWYKLSDTEDLGLTQLWAECASGIPIIAASSSPIELLDVMQIPVVLTANGSHSLIYLDDTITISGTLQFGNGTPMVGYSVEIIWDSAVLETILIIDSVAGAYSYDYQLLWDEIPRNITYYVSFVRPSEAYFDADSTSEPLEIRDVITLLLDAQTVTSVLRGDTLFVSGSVTNGGGADAEVPIELLVDPSQAGIFTISDVNGIISINFVIRDSYAPGIYNISIGVSSPYYDLTSSSGYWWIQVNITSDVTVAFESTSNVMPGESFTLSFTVADQDGNRHIGESVDIYLNDTFITTITIVDSSPNTHTILISPAQWTAGSGFFVAFVVYSGTQFVLGSSGQTTDSIHVFDEVAFTSFSPPYGVINTALTLEGILVDSAGNPIEGRTITLTRNDSIPVDLTTNEDGLFSLVSTEQFMSEGQYTFRVSFSMADGSVIRDSWTFEVTSGLPPGFDTALLITWAVVVAIEVVVAMLIVARYRYRGRAFVFPRFGFTERASEIHDSLVR